MKQHGDEKNKSQGGGGGSGVSWRNRGTRRNFSLSDL